MNQKKIKTTFIVCALAAMMITPVFAHPFRDNQDKRFDDRKTDRPCPDFPGRDNPAVMGTVKSVDTGSSIIVVTDADGNDISVHVNPMTHITKITPPAPPASKEDVRPRPDKLPDFEEVPLADVKNGTWVIVDEFDTDTKTVEARHVKLMPEKAE